MCSAPGLWAKACLTSATEAFQVVHHPLAAGSFLDLQGVGHLLLQGDPILSSIGPDLKAAALAGSTQWAGVVLLTPGQRSCPSSAAADLQVVPLGRAALGP